MITAERLQELIKQGATVYRCYSNRYTAEIYLNVENFIVAKDCPLLIETEGDMVLENHYLNKLFETKEQAEWYCKMTAERTERFEPPMWEDLVTPYHFTFIIRSEKDSSDMGVYGLHIFQSGIIIEEDIESAHSQHYLFDKDFTKENYEKACEIVRDLFNKEVQNEKL